MPNFDAGTYFLTSLAPIRAGAAEDEQGRPVSWQQRLREELARLPRADQSPATEGGENSPFSRNLRTHLCRFVIIDDVVYNGRPPSTALGNSLRGVDPIEPEPVDRLNAAYLLFAAEFDAVTEEGAPLPTELTESAQDRVRDSYAKRLWETMEPELRRIYGCCVGFEDVEDADAFAKYIRRSQVETTMPFHDYWISAPSLPQLPVGAIAVAVGAPFVAFLLGLIGWIAGSETAWILGGWFGWDARSTTLIGLALTALAVAGAYRFVMRRGMKPFPPPEHGALPALLKSIYLQQHFTRFATDQQGASDEALHAAFGEFLETHRPHDLAGPTQPPGTISVDVTGTAATGGRT